MIRLDGGGETLVLAVGEGPPRLAYWGPELPAGLDLGMIGGLAERAVPHGMLDGGEVFNLIPEAGRGFNGQPGLAVHRAGGGFVTQLNSAGASPLEDGVALTLIDLGAGVEVVLSVTLDPATGVAGFRSRLTNLGPDDLAVDWMSAAALPVGHDEVMLFEGRWSREFHPVRQRLTAGAIVQDNRTGRTSHHAPPFTVIGQPGFGEQSGEVLGLHLAWSGDHRMWVERLRDGRIQAQAGELFLPGEMILAPGAAYETPMLYAARSSTGLNGLSDRFHPFVRDGVMGGRLRGKARPVHFNTWEAVYFRHELGELTRLADLAAAVGAERFVLDDGWFKGRDDDTTSLGDWTPDPVKYPEGLGPLIDHVRGLGLEFGLWVEPEMANAASDLLRAHPDWTLHVAGRDQPLGRGQYVLDLTRPEVAGHVFDQISALLARHPIGYLKWDMNRDLTHAASGGRPASHAQTLAVYGLIDRLRAAHPEVEIESCASGGGRADYEILRRTDRIWTSDCNDPLERQTIQRGFSIFFPPEVMGAHVGPARAHTTGRRTSLALRAMTALFGHMGIEADVRDFPEADRGRLAEAIGRHKGLRPRLHEGRTLRLEHPDPGAVAFVVVDAAGAVASFAQVGTPAQPAPAPLRLAGLAPEEVYSVRLLNPARRPQATMKVAPVLARGETVRATGQMLMTMGLPLPVLRAGEIAVFQIEGG